MERRADDPAEVRRCAALLGDAAERGGRLVNSMLAFARGGGEAADPPPPLDVGATLGEMIELLSRTLGSGWRVNAVLPPDLPPAHGDRPGFEAAVVNLAANARDAMPRGGTVTIAAWVETLADADEALGLRPGRYVVAAVSDGGHGMDEATLSRLGEPFFTTKPPGLGTGLGLATVRGFCARAGGALRIDSAPGRGTTAAMWLPAA
jgi:signal transduction histidine kinase